MYAKDLMINDWVSINDSNFQVKVIKKNGVIKLYENTKFGEHEINFNSDYIEEFIQPIPLTPEILEKNGYKFNYLYYEKEGYPAIELGSKKGIYNIGKVYFSDDGDPDIHVYTSCQYVHELQHVLKICGIEKEIIV